MLRKFCTCSGMKTHHNSKAVSRFFILTRNPVIASCQHLFFSVIFSGNETWVFKFLVRMVAVIIIRLYFSSVISFFVCLSNCQELKILLLQNQVGFSFKILLLFLNFIIVDAIFVSPNLYILLSMGLNP